MAKLIAVCGAPHTGKTTLSLKLGMELYRLCGRQAVSILSPDTVVPTLGLVFPHHKETELFSVGAALDLPNIIPQDILRQMNFPKDLDGLSILGYKTGETRYTYSAPTESRAMDLIQGLLKTHQYTIVDCTNASDDIVSELARHHADQTVQVFTPDLCSMIFGTGAEENLRVLNMTAKDISLPIREAEYYLGPFAATVPYSRELKLQWITGTLTQPLGDTRYGRSVSAIAKAVR